MIRDIQDEIMRLNKENDVCILAHLYQNDAILEVADYTGDSFALAKLAQTVPNKTVLMCGVRFMAETVKMLAPDKRVLLSNPDAGCPMAEQMDREVIEQVKEDLGSDGRILVRESGTEPVIRVMVEAQSDELCAKYVDEMVQVIREEGLAVE